MHNSSAQAESDYTEIIRSSSTIMLLLLFPLSVDLLVYMVLGFFMCSRDRRVVRQQTLHEAQVVPRYCLGPPAVPWSSLGVPGCRGLQTSSSTSYSQQV